MDIATIIEALDAGYDLHQVAMLERLIGGLIVQGVADETELLRAGLLALSARLECLAT